MKQFNKIYIVSFVAVILYTLLLCVIGIFGVDIANFTRDISIFVLKWSLIILGFCFAIFLPIRIKAALVRNKKREEDAKKAYQAAIDTLREKERVKKMLKAEKLKTAIAEQTSEYNKYE